LRKILKKTKGETSQLEKEILWESETASGQEVE